MYNYFSGFFWIFQFSIWIFDIQKAENIKYIDLYNAECHKIANTLFMF